MGGNEKRKAWFLIAACVYGTPNREPVVIITRVDKWCMRLGCRLNVVHMLIQFSHGKLMSDGLFNLLIPRACFHHVKDGKSILGAKYVVIHG